MFYVLCFMFFLCFVFYVVLCFVFYVLYFMFFVLCFVFYVFVLYFVFCVLCFMFYVLCFVFYVPRTKTKNQSPKVLIEIGVLELGTRLKLQLTKCRLHRGAGPGDPIFLCQKLC